MDLRPILEFVARALEAVGVAILVGGAIYAGVRAVGDLRGEGEVFHHVRRRFGRSLLLALEILVAADIVETVMVRLTLESVTTLGILVLIRTVLSLSLGAEIEGVLPWRRRREEREEREEQSQA